ncbi:MAG: hypothetical protein ACK4R6_11725 [Spirosomataceae bacterium]
MRNTSIIIFILLIYLDKVHGQIPLVKNIDTVGVIYKEVLTNYWHECERNRYFFEDKGIVKVIIFKDSLNNNCLRLSAIIDDRFQENPTDSYTFIGANLYLIYRGDANGNEVNPSKNNKLGKALNEIVQDRVYLRPPNVERWVDSVNSKGQKMKVRAVNLRSGNIWNEMIFMFNKNGDYTKLKSL